MLFPGYVRHSVVVRLLWYSYTWRKCEQEHLSLQLWRHLPPALDSWMASHLLNIFLHDCFVGTEECHTSLST